MEENNMYTGLGVPNIEIWNQKNKKWEKFYYLTSYFEDERTIEFTSPIYYNFDEKDFLRIIIFLINNIDKKQVVYYSDVKFIDVYYNNADCKSFGEFKYIFNKKGEKHVGKNN